LLLAGGGPLPIAGGSVGLLLAGGGPLPIVGGGPLPIAGGSVALLLVGGGPLPIVGGGPLPIVGGGPLPIAGGGPPPITDGIITLKIGEGSSICGKISNLFSKTLMGSGFVVIEDISDFENPLIELKSDPNIITMITSDFNLNILICPKHRFFQFMFKDNRGDFHLCPH
jgi:hypothetical protein